MHRGTLTSRDVQNQYQKVLIFAHCGKSALCAQYQSLSFESGFFDRHWSCQAFFAPYLAAIITELKQLAAYFGLHNSSVMNLAGWDEAYEPSLDEPEDPETIEARKEKDRIERRLALEQDFTEEWLEKNWAEEKNNTVLAALESLPAKLQQSVQIKAPECRCSICRIEIEYYDEIAHSELEMPLATLVDEYFPEFSVTHEELDSMTKTIYFLQSNKRERQESARELRTVDNKLPEYSPIRMENIRTLQPAPVFL